MNQLMSSLARFNRQEQAMLLIGTFGLVLLIVWLLLLAPLQHRRDQLLATNIAIVQSFGRVQLLASQVENLLQQSAQAGAGSENLSGEINSSLGENGISMSNMVPSAGEIRVRIDKANSEALLQWLYDLETKHHIVIRELSITALNEPGQVAVTVRLIKP